MELYLKYREDQEADVCLLKHQQAMALFKPTVKDLNFFGNKAALYAFPWTSSFLELMKDVISDFYVNCNRVTPLDPNDERTFYAEAAIAIFEFFCWLILRKVSIITIVESQ